MRKREKETHEEENNKEKKMFIFVVVCEIKRSTIELYAVMIHGYLMAQMQTWLDF